ncbi:MAG: signal peptidase I, partial [Pseudomonadota bacterium]
MILPLLLTVGVLLSGAIVALDRWWLRARRGPVDALAGVPEPMLVATARAVFPVLLFVWLLRSFVAEPFRIPSESMLPQLQVGDFVLVNKYAYGLRLPVLNTLVVPLGEPQRGDVMVFVPPHKNLYLIKRVIGLPGDRVSFRDGQLFVNGERATLELIAEREQRVRGVTLPALEYLETLDGAAHR